MAKRKPKYLGTGIHVHHQPFLSPKKCVKGDTFFDADWGDMKFNGKKWVQYNRNNKKQSV